MVRDLNDNIEVTRKMEGSGSTFWFELWLDLLEVILHISDHIGREF
jgi:hypothetical protein